MISFRLPVSHVSLGLTLLLLAGCGEAPEARFSWSEETEDLTPMANAWVKRAVLQNFGTPNELVAWERLPVDYGGFAGTVTAIEPVEGGGTKLKVKFADGTTAPASARQLLWKSGTRTDEADPDGVASVVAGEAETVVLTSKPLDPAPEVGDEFALDPGHRLIDGRRSYLKNCMHCHGVAGDGAGPTARYLNPLPRDFRRGVMKFTSTRPGERISREDLARTIREGIPGTYMPSFLLMDPDEMTAVIEYVRWLSMRGEFEKRLNDELKDFSRTAIAEEEKNARLEYEAAVKDDPNAEAPLSADKLLTKAEEDFRGMAEDLEFVFLDAGDLMAGPWERADEPDNIITPSIARVADTPESREKGRLLYLSQKTKCYTCHGSTGKGDGPATEDFWLITGSSETYPERGLHDEWGHVIPPRDLTRGQYRGGRRPIDVFRRLYAGIKGTPMPAFGGSSFTDEELWHLVNYVMALPYQEQSTTAAKPPAAVATSK